MSEGSGDERVRVTVERVTDAQWRTYRDVRLAMLADSPRSFGSTYAVTSERTDEDWRSFVAQAVLWLAWDSDGMAGFDGAVGSVGLYADPLLPPGSAYLVGMWVHPAGRRAGTGEALVRAVVAEAVARRLDRLVLDVADENLGARRLYDRMGFVVTGRTGSLPWDETITETEYRLDLRPCQS